MYRCFAVNTFPFDFVATPNFTKPAQQWLGAAQ
jgi:hypothetical protein